MILQFSIAGSEISNEFNNYHRIEVFVSLGNVDGGELGDKSVPALSLILGTLPMLVESEHDLRAVS